MPFSWAPALKPDYDLAVFNMANVYRTIGKDDEALVGYRRLLELDPGNPQARSGGRAGARGLRPARRDAEEALLNRALAIQPAMAAARNTLGALRLKQGDVAAGDREDPGCPRAERQPAAGPLQPRPGRRAARRFGRGPLPINQQEIARFAGSYMAQFNLGKVYERLGKVVEQAAAFRAAIRQQSRLRRRPPVSGQAPARPRAIAPTPSGWHAAASSSTPAPSRGLPVTSSSPTPMLADGRADEAARESAEGRRLAARTNTR